jgi:hypothetical protein
MESLGSRKDLILKIAGHKDETVWKYKADRKVKHFFFNATRTTAICGAAILWYLPLDAQWQQDTEGLNKRRPCGQCLRCINSKE